MVDFDVKLSGNLYPWLQVIFTVVPNKALFVSALANNTVGTGGQVITNKSWKRKYHNLFIIDYKYRK